MKKNHLLFDCFWLTLILSFIFLYFGSDHSLLNPDESRYSEVAREMLATGDFITPRLNNIIFFDKPILYYWLQTISIRWFGLNEWALRFFPTLFGIVGCLFTYITGHSLFSRRVGIYSAAILASSPLYYLASHYANMDLEVAVMITACLSCFIVAIQKNYQKQRGWLMYLAYFFSALAILTKGLIGIVFPTMIIGLWILITGQWQIVKEMRLFRGFIIILLIISPWFYLVQSANPNFFHYFFTVQHIERFLSSDFNSQTPFWFYIPIISLGSFPWLFLFISSILHYTKNILKNPNLLFLLIWFFLILVFFSLPKSKLVGYILPVFPALSLITGYYLTQNIQTLKKWSIRIIIICNFFLIALLLALALKYPLISGLPAPNPAILLSVILLILNLSILVAYIRTNIETTWHTVMFAATIGILGLCLILPKLPLPTNKPLIEKILAIKQPDDKLIGYFHYFYDLPIYSQQTITVVDNWDDANIGRKDNWRKLFLYGLGETHSHEQLIKPTTLWQQWNQGQRLFVFVRKAHVDYLRSNVQPVIVIAELNNYAVVSNQN